MTDAVLTKRRRGRSKGTEMPSASNDVSRADSVYSRLLQAINRGELTPGQRVRELEIAQWLGVSRTPVREALHRLESEDVIAKSEHGLIVPLMDDTQIEALYFMREVLEGAAAALAPITKNVARLPCRRSSSTRAGVVTASGPSSNVSAT